MSHEAIQTAFERNRKALSIRAGIGIGTAVTKVRVEDGLACISEDGRWTLNVDMSEKSGGAGSAPDPGVFGRTALGSCLTIAYSMWAAYRGVPIDSLSVEIEADYNSGGTYGTSDTPPGYSQVRYVVNLESSASETEISNLLQEAEDHCPYLDIFRRPLDVRREVRLVTASR